MPLLSAETKLCEPRLGEPTLVPVSNRVGIYLGTGDKSIRTVCEGKGLDCHFFLTILNTFIDEAYFPEKRLQSFCAAQIVDYLTKTNLYYQRFQLPNIERHMNSLIEKSDTDNNNLEWIRKFFIEFKKELLARIEHDHTVWFPEIMGHYKRLSQQGKVDDLHLKHRCDEQEEIIEEKLNDLKNLFILHLSGSYDVNLCYAVIFALYSLEKDIRQHNRIRNRILQPMSEAMKQIQ